MKYINSNLYAFGMVALFVLLVLVTALHAQSVRRDDKWPPFLVKSFFKTLHNDCVSKSGVTEDAIVRFSDVEIFDNDPKLKCYMSCLFLEAGLTDDDGQLHLEKLVDTVNLLDDTSQLIFLKMAKRCLRPVKTDACESAFWYHKCWKTSDPVHYFLY